MSTIVAAIMCYLTDPDAFSRANRSLTRDIYETRFCKDKNEYKSLSALTEKTGTKVYDWRLYTVVRDPVDRFLSGFVDKCVLEKKMRPNKCYGCGQNMSCFLHELFERGRHFGAGKPIGYSYDDIHFYPQNWHCEFSLHMQRYAIIHYASEEHKYEAMLNDMALVFAEQGVPASLMRHILEALTSSRTRHATVASPERRYYEAQLRSDSKLMNLLVRIFYYDYVLLGFQLPF